MSRVADPKAKSTLLRAAEEVFAERGLGNAKVEEIARRAGVSKGAFYLHFESKEAALKQIVESFLARCSSFFAPPSAYPELPEDANAMLDYCLERDRHIYEFLWQSRAILRILPTCQGQYDYLVEAFHHEIQRTNREWIDWWKSEGYFRAEVDTRLTTTLVHGAYAELVAEMLRSHGRPPLEHWLECAQEMLVRAFGTANLIGALEDRNLRTSQSIEARGEPRAGLAAGASAASNAEPRAEGYRDGQ
jgi:AcrR family transcriptional regulator